MQGGLLQFFFYNQYRSRRSLKPTQPRGEVGDRQNHCGFNRKLRLRESLSEIQTPFRV
jgi:hypothetical protein